MHGYWPIVLVQNVSMYSYVIPTCCIKKAGTCIPFSSPFLMFGRSFVEADAGTLDVEKKSKKPKRAQKH